MMTLEETDCKGVVELQETLQQNMYRYFYGGDVRQHLISIKKSQLHVVATLLDPRLEMGFFHEEKLIRQSYCWFSWLQQDEPKQLKTRLIGALRYFQAIVAISGCLQHCPIYTCNGQTLRLHFGSFKYVATISFALTYGSSD